MRDTIKGQLSATIKENFVPNTLVEYSIFDAYTAWKNCVAKYKKSKVISELQYRKAGADQSVAIDGRCFRQNILYIDNTTSMIKKLTGKQLRKNQLPKIHLSEPVQSTSVLRILHKRNSGKWFVCVPIPMETVTFPSKNPVVSIDPGVRTFATCYDGQTFEKLGTGDAKRIHNLYRHHDKLVERAKSIKNYHRRRRMYKAANKITNKVTNLVDELHWKIADYLTKKYDIILLPKFNTSRMVGTLPPVVSRTMNSLAHYKFRMRMIHKCRERGCQLVLVNEAYTSKTCTVCGNIDVNLGKASIYSCKKCGSKIDRDYNGARNIMLRALRDVSI